MDSSENRLFGDVRSAFHPKLWETDPDKFREVMEEGYWLLPEDYRAYLLENLEKVPWQLRRLSYEDVSPERIDQYAYGRVPLDPFLLAYVRHADFEYLKRTTPKAQFETLWDTFKSMRNIWGLITKKCRETLPMTKRRLSSDFVVQLPLKGVTIPRDINLESMWDNTLYNMEVVPHLEYMLHLPGAVFTLNERVLRQAFHVYGTSWDGFQETDTHLSLSALRCTATNDEVRPVIRIEVALPNVFFGELEDDASDLMKYLSHYKWDFMFEFVLPHQHIWRSMRSKYVQTLQKVCGSHTQFEMRLAEDVWDNGIEPTVVMSNV